MFRERHRLHANNLRVSDATLAHSAAAGGRGLAATAQFLITTEIAERKAA